MPGTTNNSGLAATKWALVGVLLAAGYPALLGPVSWLSERTDDGKVFSLLYGPVIRWMCRDGGHRSPYFERRLKDFVFQYMTLGVRRNTRPIIDRHGTVEWTSMPVFWTGPGFYDRRPEVNRFFVRPSPPPDFSGGFGGRMGK